MQRLKQVVVLFLILTFWTSILGADDSNKVITMVYKEGHKMPLIGDLEDDSGLYKELFEKAAKSIGYELKIVRTPKKRVHAELAKGSVDFYPGASYSTKRAEYLYYLPNGLETKEVIVTRADSPEIGSISGLKGRLLVELGSSKFGLGDKYEDIELVRMREMTMDTVVKAITSNRADFYIADIEVVDYFKKENKIKDFKDIGIKIHNYAVNKEFIPMYMGFSRNSKLFSETPNSDFNPEKEVTIQNYPTLVSKDSVAYKLFMALDELKKSGETEKIYNKYFK